jgi:hypothetical protein
MTKSYLFFRKSESAQWILDASLETKVLACLAFNEGSGRHQHAVPS